MLKMKCDLKGNKVIAVYSTAKALKEIIESRISYEILMDNQKVLSFKTVLIKNDDLLQELSNDGINVEDYNKVKVVDKDTLKYESDIKIDLMMIESVDSNNGGYRVIFFNVNKESKKNIPVLLAYIKQCELAYVIKQISDLGVCFNDEL